MEESINYIIPLVISLAFVTELATLPFPYTQVEDIAVTPLGGVLKLEI